MSEQIIFDKILLGWSALAFLVFAALFFFPAPYGRHKLKRGWSIPDSWGWVIMEIPAVLVFGGMFLAGAHRGTGTALVFLLMWMAHYFQRTFIYPFLQRKSRRKMPWQVVGMGFLFNMVNGYLNGRYLFEFSGGYPDEWLKDWRFLLGGGLFIIGYAVNRDADRVLCALRQTNLREYEIPKKGLYRWISCPNYFGEMVLWIGWAIATWSLAGWAFAAWTIANLAPRAWAHHRWYQEQFSDYPPERRALLPGIW
jgi:protein-S-isoprenylcysteine O-methyltransferase Ste14